MKRYISNFAALSGKRASLLKGNGSLMLALSACTLLSASPVYAEDIEIYISPAPDSGGANVLLLIDTSGGTNRKFPGTSFSDGGKTIDEISFALRQVVGGLAGSTRLGIASQLAGGDNGGAINYPVAQIDESADPVGFARVASLQGDAYQSFMVPAVPMEMNDASVSWDVFPVQDETLPMPSILSTSETETVAGFQFSGLAVPRYARITAARMTLQSPSPNSGATNNFSLRIAHERAASPVPLTAAADFASRSWSLPFDNGGGSYNAKGTLNNGEISIDVTDVVQSAVRDHLWCGGQIMSLVIQGTSISVSSVPKIYSYRAENADGARLGISTLEVEWDAGSSAPPLYPGDVASGSDAALSCMKNVTIALASGSDDGTETDTGKNLQTGETELLLRDVTSGAASGRGNYLAGIRFANVGFPVGAKVSRADLSGRVTSVSGAAAMFSVTTLLGDVPPFVANGDISGHPVGSEAVKVSAVVGDFTADVTALVNESLKHGSWTDGGALGFIYQRLSGTSIGIHALERGAASAALLKMDVLTPSPGDFVSVFSRRDQMIAAVDRFSDAKGGGNNKPTSAYLESAHYMLGLSPVFGKSFSHEEAFVDSSRARYLSPGEDYDQCGGNHIIMVTHAESSGEYFKAAIDSLIGNTAECPSDGNSDAWTCATALSGWLADGGRNTSGVPVVTHTVAFAPAKDDTYAGLESVAKASGGMYEKSEDALKLAEVLSKMIDSLTTADASMAAPGVAVNQLNRFQHLDELYYALFRPALNTYWEGNLKRYKLDFSMKPPQIVDQKGTPAVDPETGFFRDTTNSWWGLRADGTDADDGQRVDSGGAREELAHRAVPRKLLVTVPGSSALRLVDAVEDITPAEIGMDASLYPDATERKAEMQDRLDRLLLEGWADPLHTEPRLVNYGFSGDIADAALDTSLQDNTVFVSTNGGMLHAIDPKNGNELFAIMPAEELLKTEKRYQSETLDAKDPQRSTYGLDGGITVWRRGGADGKPDHVYLYAGQRRGGRSYYALDVTDRSSPKLLWQINGGSGSFTELAQTWSQPTFAQILQGGVRTPVLVFGGGYSATDHDTATSFSSTGDAAGNAIFIVNAKTGALIKRFSSGDNADMKWSIASSVSVVDVDFDGIADFLYAADLAGQVFRVDLNRVEGATDSLSSTRVATVAQLGRTVDTGSANQRRFYASPTIAMSRRGGENVLQVLIGSGYRTYPLNTAAEDRFYALNDADALLAPTSLSPALRASDLSDITDGSSYDETSKGWMYRLTEPGEKVLSNAVVMEGVVYFTTFLPESRSVNKCQRVIGASRLYGLSLLKGAPAIDFDNDGFFDPFRELILPGLPPSPQLLLGPEGQQVLLTGTAATDIGDAAGLGLRRTRWYQVPNKEAAEDVLEEATLVQ